ncbi:unnamed protein product [Arctia plantaginis]|uniref:Uncharacterized protein n=1 Tax=Arctia plantaginis TaxID=874455 RepID=A0A8S0YUU2_ARCPL|nr:unnamed protein product [Arctia plantaginis]
MKVLYFLCLVVFCKGFPLNSTPDNVQTDETALSSVVTQDKVESSNAADTVAGCMRAKERTIIAEKVEITYVTPIPIDDSQVTELKLDSENEPQKPSVEVAGRYVSADKNEYTMKKRKA